MKLPQIFSKLLSKILEIGKPIEVKYRFAFALQSMSLSDSVRVMFPY